jgi:uncharacterized protein DUF3703
MGTMSCIATAPVNERFEEQMALGEEFLKRGNYTAATAHFYRAHTAGREVKVHHVHAHWGLLRAGWGRRSPRQVVTQFFLFTLSRFF